MKKLILVAFLFSMNLYAQTLGDRVIPKTCRIELFSKVYRLESSQTLGTQDIIRKSDCEDSLNLKLSQIVANSNGSASAEFLQRELAREYLNINIEITPRKLTFLDLNISLREQLASGTNLYFLDTKSLNGLRSLGLVEGEQLQSICESCTSFGEKNIKIDISNPLSSTLRTVWFTSKMMAKIKVFKAKRTLSFQQKHLTADDFYSDEIFSGNPDNTLSNLENIAFYKANKTIQQGAIVSNLDLQAVNLINYGIPVSVTLKNQNINLQKTALPTRSAQFGELIELKNPNSNKAIAGRVVDYNKVVIEL